MTEARAGAARPAAVVLDAGGVLVVPHPDHLRAGIPELRATGAADRAVVRAHYAGVAAIDGFGLPASWEAYCTAFLLEAGVTSAGLRSAVPALREVIQSVPGLWSYIPPGVSDGLRRLAACGVALAVVSNSDGTIEAQLRADAVCQVGEGGGTPVAVVVDSHRCGKARSRHLHARPRGPRRGTCRVLVRRRHGGGRRGRRPGGGAGACPSRPVRLLPSGGPRPRDRPPRGRRPRRPVRACVNEAGCARAEAKPPAGRTVGGDDDLRPAVRPIPGGVRTR